MNYLTSEKFSFHSKAVDENAFGVVRFSGTEGLSQLYHFDITLIADDANIDMDAVLQERASFFIHRPDGSKVPFHGVLAEFDLVRDVGEYYVYRALLVPKLWLLTLTNHNQIFLNKSPKDIISELLEDGGLTPLDFEFRLQGSYVTWEYACQYGESYFNFISRWMERNGMYYFFDQSGNIEKLIITDTKVSHSAPPDGKKVIYSPVSGVEAFHLDESVQSFICRRKTVSQKVLLKDYNYRKPSLEVKGQANVSDRGHGAMYYYGDHFRTPEEGNKLAQIRSEELLCKAKQFHGESSVPYLRPGYTVELEKHFRNDMNRGYLTVDINHHGNQASALISGLREQLAEAEQESVYRNTFTVIGDDVQFRADRITKRPRLSGTINGKIDASGSGQYAELDNEGRYKVILPFDLSGRSGGKASAWIRMMQPYGGSDHGMHFPLHKGAEVLLTFIDGDPDRPVIVGAVTNIDNPSLVNNVNQTSGELKTGSGNLIHFEDEKGKERIEIYSPNKNSTIALGDNTEKKEWYQITGDVISGIIGYKESILRGVFDLVGLIYPKSNWTGEVDKGIQISSKGGLKLDVTIMNEAVGGITRPGIKDSSVVGGSFASVKGLSTRSIMGMDDDMVVGPSTRTRIGTETRYDTLKEYITAQKDSIKGVYTKIVNTGTSIANGSKKVYAWATELTGSKEKVGEEEIEMLEIKTSIHEENTEMDSESTIMSGERTSLTGEETELVESRSDIVGESTSLSGEHTSMHGEQTLMLGEMTFMAGESTSLAGEEIEMMEIKTII